MKTLFISCQNIDGSDAQNLIQALEKNGFAVEHSPRNPMDGDDERWNRWYDELLPETIERSNAFVVVVDKGWDSSTWMGIEGEEALGRRRKRPALPMFVYNPMNVVVRASAMSTYLREPLPSEAQEAANYLQQRL